MASIAGVLLDLTGIGGYLDVMRERLRSTGPAVHPDQVGRLAQEVAAIKDTVETLFMRTMAGEFYAPVEPGVFYGRPQDNR